MPKTLEQRGLFKLNSEAHNDSFGAFYPLLAAISTSELPSALADERSEIQQALLSFAEFHELRHFHDYFSSPAGWLAFGLHVEQTHDFLDTCRRLHDDKMVWSLPLTRWISSSTCPDYVTEFCARTANRTARTNAYYGRLESEVVPGHSDSLIRFVDGPNGRIAEGAMRGLDEKEGRPLTTWVSIGLETLLECNASALERSWAESVWGGEIANGIWRARGRLQVIETADVIELAERPMPYNMIDALVSRRIRATGFDRPWNRDLLHAIVDDTLCSTASKDDGLGVALAARIDRLGARSPTIENVNGNELLSAGYYPEDPRSPELWQNLAALWDRQPKPDDASESPTNYVERYVMHNIIKPLAQSRFDNVWLYSRTGEYLERVSELPGPILVANGDWGRFRDDMSPQAQRLWIEHVMTVDLMEQILGDAAVVTCPRAYKRIPGWRTFELTSDGMCTSHVERGDCMHWSSARRRPLPRCGFSFVLAVLGVRGIAP
jgi:hypothetical protein